MKNKTLLFWTIMVFITLVGCSETNQQDNPVEEILQTDRAFSSLSQEKGVVEAFLAFADDQSVLLRDNGYPLVGKIAVKEYMEKRPAKSVIMTWTPLFAEAAVSGDLGYSYGIFQVFLEETKEEPVSEGCYVSIWKRQKDGSWKWVLDAGTEGLKEKGNENT